MAEAPGMTRPQILAQAVVLATFFGVFMAVVAYFNGKHIKEATLRVEKMHQDTQKMIQEGNERVEKMIQESARQTQALLERMAKETREVLDRMDARAEGRHRELLAKAGLGEG